jgi:hypothetical protein
MNKDYVLIIVFSNWVLSKIYNFFIDYLNAQDYEFGIGKIERYTDKRTGEMRDSNRTLMLIKRSLFNRALDKKLDLIHKDLDFRISEYILTDKNFPQEGYCSNFYIILPKNIPYDECHFALKEKFQELVKFQLLSEEDYFIKIPFKSRLTGEHRGFSYITFSKNINIKERAYIKALFNDSFVFLPSINKLYHLPLFWAREIKEFKEQSYETPVYKILKR